MMLDLSSGVDAPLPCPTAAVVRGNEALNSAVGHKVTKLSVLSESELINLKEIFDRISGESATINQASFMSFLSSISPTMAKEVRTRRGALDRNEAIAWREPPERVSRDRAGYEKG